MRFTMVSRRLAPPIMPGLAAGLAVAVVAMAALAKPDSRVKLERLNVEETTLAGQQGRNLNQLSRLLSVLERLARDPPPALLVSPRDAKDAVRAAILVRAMTPELQARAQAYAAEAGEIARQRRLAAVESEALFAADSAQAERRPEPAPDDGLLDFAQEAPVVPPEVLLMPAAGPLKHRFGDPLATGGRANGLTIVTDPAACVRSPDVGLVQYVGPVKGWGVILILKLAGGYHLVLGGLDRTSVEVGQSVAAGAPVGFMPNGRQSPPELYFEVREQGSPMDPARWLKKG